MIPKLYIQENIHLRDEPYDNIWGSGVPDQASVDLVEWIQAGIADGTFQGNGIAGASNLGLGILTSTTLAITNTNGTGVTLPSATISNAGLMPAARLVNLNSLITLTGVAANAFDLGAFAGTTIGATATIKSALQSLETAVESKSSALVFQDEGFSTGLAGSATTINFVGSALTATQVGSVLTVVGTGGSSSVTAAEEYYTVIPTGINIIPDLPVAPTAPTKVLIAVNGQIEKNGISVNASGQFTVTPLILGYNIDPTDVIVVQYFTT